jgi:hypothetical protein
MKKTLTEQTISYLEAEGYKMQLRPGGLLNGTKKGFVGLSENIYVWVLDDEPSQVRAQEARLLKQFGDISAASPFGHRFLLTQSLEGLSKEFRDEARRWYNIRVAIPATFFDTAFTWELSPEASGAARRLADRGEEKLRLRIPQPFTHTVGDGEPGADLLPHLVDRLRGPAKQDKAVHFVIGPAGIGKTYLFESLFAELYNKFHQDKRAQRPAPRPLPLLPDHLELADGPSVRALVRALLESEFSRKLDMPAFEWMLANNTGAWLIDGLDEIIAQDPDFFNFLLDTAMLSGGVGSPSIVICVRDSLLASNNDLREFIESYSEIVDVYRLEKWSSASKRRFAIMRFHAEPEPFLTQLDQSPVTQELSATPYYCDLLAQLFETDRMIKLSGEEELLQIAADELIERDYKRGILSRSAVRKDEVLEVIEVLSMEDYERAFCGIPVDNARDLALTIMPAELPEYEVAKFVEQFAQIAFMTFVPPRRLRFAQEALEQYFLGRGLIRSFDQRPEAFRTRLAYRQIPWDWVTLRMVAQHIKSKNARGQIGLMLFDAVGGPESLKNLLQIAVLANEDRGRIFPKEFIVERQDLSGVVFMGVDLRGVSFRGCDLTNTAFRECDLREASFEDAVLMNTAFEGLSEDSLNEVQIGELTRFYSIRVDRGRVIANHREARRWFEARKGTPGQLLAPCPAALQLRHLFGKFIEPDGRGRRLWLDVRGSLAGRKYGDPAGTMSAALKFGYLIRDTGRPRVFRAEGDAYAEMVGYVTDMRLTPGLQSVLSETCDLDGCNHIPVVTV